MLDKLMASAAAAACALSACAAPTQASRTVAGPERQVVRTQSAEAELHLLNRLTWGASASAARELQAFGAERYLERQLRPGRAVLPPVVVLGGLFARMYGLGDAQIARIFPGVRPKDLGLV